MKRLSSRNRRGEKHSESMKALFLSLNICDWQLWKIKTSGIQWKRPTSHLFRYRAASEQDPGYLDLIFCTTSVCGVREKTSVHLHQPLHPDQCLHIIQSSQFTFTFMHLADAFIQSDLQFLSVHVFPGNRTHNLCAANAML